MPLELEYLRERTSTRGIPWGQYQLLLASYEEALRLMDELHECALIEDAATAQAEDVEPEPEMPTHECDEPERDTLKNLGVEWRP